MSNLPQDNRSKSIAELEAEAKADQAFMDNVRVFVDISGSMAGGFTNSVDTKHQAAQKALTVLWESSDWSICDMKVWAFDEFCQEIISSPERAPILPPINGGTSFIAPLREALKDSITTRIILCSDGQAQYPKDEVARCIERTIPVDTIYISGNDNEYYNETLLRRISEETGGQFATVDSVEALTQAFACLETSQRLLLESPADSVIKL